VDISKLNKANEILRNIAIAKDKLALVGNSAKSLDVTNTKNSTAIRIEPEIQLIIHDKLTNYYIDKINQLDKEMEEL